MSEFSIGIDLGGTKIAGIVLGPGNEVLWKDRVPTPKGDYRATLAAIEHLVARAREVCTGEPVNVVGMGIPGEMSSDGHTVKNANSTCLIGQPLGADLQARLGLELRIANDANCFALSEATDGAAVGASVVFGVILGTGVGGGLVLNGQMHRGANRLAGEWGHNPMPLLGEPPKGRACYCGQTDCIETWLSGPAFARDFAVATGRELTAADIAGLAAQGDQAAMAALDQYTTHLAKALSGLVNMLDPDVIVLGGGMSNIGALYEAVPAKLSDYVFNATDQPVDIKTRILRNHWGDDSGVRGAAWLCRMSGNP